MNSHEIENSSTTEEGLPVAPSMGPALQFARLPTHATPINPRVLYICFLCAVIGLVAGYVAQGLIALIAFFTNVSFFGRFSFQHVVARDNHLGIFVILIPIIGALVIGLIARYGSRSVAGHGIPEAMEQVLINESRIPPKMTFLKPLSAAISIGTGGPFGAEGPIIATGGAVGSLIGQLLSTTPAERKILLSAGAAAGIAAAFGSPIAAVLLAIELLLFEFRPRSIIPVVFACVVAAMIHMRMEGAEPFFKFSGAEVVSASQSALLIYIGIGALAGVGSVIMTRAVYAVEHFFEHLAEHTPIHWMWCPAVGAVAVGVIGYIRPETLGPGYFNIDHLLSDHVVLGAAAALCIWKFLSWTISLGSGTAGGTLAPVFTIGGALGAVLAIGAAKLFPQAGIDVRVAALVGMVSIFAGASRALLTSAVFAFETTLQPTCIVPALCGCSAAYLVSSLLMRHSIMTDKMSRQGVRVPADYSADPLESVLVSEAASREPILIDGERAVADLRTWINSGAPGSQHQGYPIVDSSGLLLGILTRRDLMNPAHSPDMPVRQLIHRQPICIYDDSTLRDAADHMANHDIGRLPVIDRARGRVIGILTRGDLLSSHGRQLRAAKEAKPTLRWPSRETPSIDRASGA